MAGDASARVSASVHPLRSFIKTAKRVVVKVGTAVVTRNGDRRLSVGRLGQLCEQVEALMRQHGMSVVLVTSGAVCVGQQKLGYQQMLHTSPLDRLNNQTELHGKACAAIGQNGLMSLYETLFHQLDIPCSQLLVTDRDFANPEFREQLKATVDSLVSLGVVPIFNENDAISTRKAPYKDSQGIFWDNDSLAALLALELRADLMILLSDVDGLYTGPPSDPASKLINTYVRERHLETVTFGEKSRVGRGGMTAKLDAAWTSAEAGIPVVIASGSRPNVLVEVVRGQNVGTLFHRDAPTWVNSLRKSGAREMAVAARTASRKLQGMTSKERTQILYKIAEALEANEEAILEENEADLRAAETAGIAPALLQRLKLKAGRIAQLADGMRAIAAMTEPIGKIISRTELAEGLILDKTTSPLGVLLIIFESRPDVLPQIAALAIRSGNGLLLKGGKEAVKSNSILHKVITEALPASVGPELIGLVRTRDAISDLLQLDDVIDLVIPRGSNQLVNHIKQNTKIPVLGHADGVCHVFVDKDADLRKAKKLVVDAKIDYPAACNAMETMLVHKDLVESGGFQELCDALVAAGVVLNGSKKTAPLLNLPVAPNFHKEYGCNECTVEIVDDVGAAIAHIHEFGSAHTDTIVTENKEAAEYFLKNLDSAVVLHNASTRFSDGYRFGLGAEVGVSTSRIHARGPVGVEGLLTTRWLGRGTGQIVAKDKAIKYTHRQLPIPSSEAAPSENGV